MRTDQIVQKSGRQKTYRSAWLIFSFSLLIFLSFYSCKQRAKTQGNLYRIIDHFETITFHKTPVDVSIL
ncbi:MAG: hypothetical protein PVH84_17170, partial [Candidatus Aminicenantes bacterium]